MIDLVVGQFGLGAEMGVEMLPVLWRGVYARSPKL